MAKSAKSTISMAMFTSFLYVYQAGYHIPSSDHLDALRHDVGVGWGEGTVVGVADVVNATHLEPQ